MKQIIRRLSSFIGDPCENAETIQALHNDICKFGVPTDPGYRAVVRALAGFITIEEEAVSNSLTSIFQVKKLISFGLAPRLNYQGERYPGS
jgi:hypothetical protein